MRILQSKIKTYSQSSNDWGAQKLDQNNEIGFFLSCFWVFFWRVKIQLSALSVKSTMGYSVKKTILDKMFFHFWGQILKVGSLYLFKTLHFGVLNATWYSIWLIWAACSVKMNKLQFFIFGAKYCHKFT